MATPSTMIVSALILTGDKAVGGTLSAAEQTEYLSRLNMMLESWSNEALMVYVNQDVTKVLTAGVGTYTIGTGQSINTTWPIKIDSAYTVDGSNISRYISNFVDDDGWAGVVLKQLGNSYPDTLFYDRAYPIGVINLWPLPVSGLTLHLNCWLRLQSFATIGDTVTLPPGYEMAIITNLAIFLGLGSSVISDDLRQLAKTSKATIKGVNVSVPVMNLPDELTGASDWFNQFPVPV